MKESKPVIFGSGASSSKDFKSLYINCHAALTNGITHFDTAPSYATEEVLSQAVQRSANELGLKRSDYQIQTKIDPIQMYNGKVVEYFKRTAVYSYPYRYISFTTCFNHRFHPIHRADISGIYPYPLSLCRPATLWCQYMDRRYHSIMGSFGEANTCGIKLLFRFFICWVDQTTIIIRLRIQPSCCIYMEFCRRRR